jgi:hypothetical protein
MQQIAGAESVCGSAAVIHLSKSSGSGLVGPFVVFYQV